MGEKHGLFSATKLLRAQGAGPTLLISPLLSLMRHQFEAAQRIGITARTINSTNNDKYQAKRFSDEPVTACVNMLQTWSPSPSPQWVTCIPSLNQPKLVAAFAARLAGALGLPFVPCSKKVRATGSKKRWKTATSKLQAFQSLFYYKG